MITEFPLEALEEWASAVDNQFEYANQLIVETLDKVRQLNPDADTLARMTTLCEAQKSFDSLVRVTERYQFEVSALRRKHEELAQAFVNLSARVDKLEKR